MKNLVFKSILVIGLATTIVACSKDEETSGTPTASVVGNWEAKLETETAIVNGQSTIDTTQVYAANELVVNFNSNGMAIATFNSTAKDTSTYTLSGSTLTLISLDKTDTTVFNETTVSGSVLNLGTTETDVIGGVTVISKTNIILNKK